MAEINDGLTEQLTEDDIKDLKRSWGKNWHIQAGGKANAVRKARALTALLKGKGWKPMVFENLGWHYHVLNFPFSVSEYEPGEYSVLMSDCIEYPTAGAGFWSNDNFRSKDPNEAVAHQLKIAEHFVKHLSEVIEQGREACKEEA